MNTVEATFFAWRSQKSSLDKVGFALGLWVQKL